MNLIDWIILLIIAEAVYLAVRTLRSGKKRGCSGYCRACPYHCSVQRTKKEIR